ncbi:hypothetical protein LCGC14_2759260, partial [marine sediment metagenome]
MGQQVNVYRKLKMFPGAIVEGSWNGSFDTGGTTYYVNNITGSSTADGLSWNNPCDQVSTAITLSEASRLIHPGTTTNDYIRNTIVVQGTGTAYTALTALPSYCDVIGLGVDPRGNGTGIARIGADTGTGESGVVATATVRGTNFYNLQFQAGLDGYPFKGTNFFRCRWENCVFATNGSPAGQPAAGFEAGICSGNVWKNCHWITASSIGTDSAIGMNITSTHFHNCLVEDCYIAGTTAAIVIAAGCVNGYGSIVRG